MPGAEARRDTPCRQRGAHASTDRHGQVIDVVLRTRRNAKAARRFLTSRRRAFLAVGDAVGRP
jgi:hypothetical protein